MNPSTTIPLTQMIISWTLLGVLLAWTLLCAFLALRPLKAKPQRIAELPTQAGAFPLQVPRTPLHRPSLYAEAAVEDIAAAAASAESSSEMSTAPVA